MSRAVETTDPFCKNCGGTRSAHASEELLGRRCLPGRDSWFVERIELSGGQQSDHNCMDYRERGLSEGDDVITEHCTKCGRVRFETDGVRPMAWFIDRSNPTGNRYAYSDPRNDPKKPTQWKYPGISSSGRNKE